MVLHGIFRRLQYANSALMRINLALLMAVSFLPFPTSLLAEAITETDPERAAVIFYGATLLLISLLGERAVGHCRAEPRVAPTGGDRPGGQRDPRRDHRARLQAVLLGLGATFFVGTVVFLATLPVTVAI